MGTRQPTLPSMQESSSGAQILPANEEEIATEEKPSVRVNNRRISIICGVASLSAAIIGFEVGTADNFISSSQFITAFGKPNDLVLGLIMSSFNLGSIIGCLLCLWLKRFKFNNILKIGYGIYTFAAVLYLVNWIGSTQYLPLLIIYRIICGISGGICLLMCPIYVSKLTLDDSTRGANLSLFQLNLCLGILIGNLLNLFMDPFHIQILLNVVVMLISVPSYWVLPSVITQEPNPENIKKFFRGPTDLEYLEETVNSQSATFRWRKLLIGVGLMAFQQLTGINFFFYYSKQLIPSNELILVLSIANLVGSLITLVIVDRFPRLALLAFGSIMLSVLLLVYYLVGHFSVIYFIILIFAVSWGPVSGIIMNEVTGSHQTMLTVSILSNFIFNFLIINLTPLVMSAISLNILFIFIGAMVVSLGLIFFIPETGSLSRDEIENWFDTNEVHQLDKQEKQCPASLA